MNKPLFIFSNDFGELVLLRLLLYKQDIHVNLALPERLFEHVEFAHATKYLYRNYKELTQYISQSAPSQVVFFSAYLIAPNNLITYDEFYELLDSLDKKNIPISTSDPFLRYYDQRDYEPQANELYPHVRNRLKEISERLAVYPHLYSVPVSFDTAPYRCFSNTAKRYVSEQSDHKKQWTFIMAWEDYSLLQIKHEGMYHNIMIPFINALVQQHNVTVKLIFPQDFYDILQVRLTHLSDVEYINYCSLTQFEKIIATSDVVFYWNLFSISTLLCRLYNKPTVFLDKGHMETIYPGFYEYSKGSWFPDKQAEIMDVNNDLIRCVMDSLIETNQPSRFCYPYYHLESPSQVFSLNEVEPVP